jgi:hypothetical protein
MTTSIASKVNYYPMQKNWRKIGPSYRHPELKRLIYNEMEDFALGRAIDREADYEYSDFNLNVLPRYYDSCDWRWSLGSGIRGRKPAFWDYACHSACHWTAQINLAVAMRAEPKRKWRLVSSDKHTTVWDGETTLFDSNFLALEVPTTEAWELAAEQDDSRILAAGEFDLHGWDEEDLDSSRDAIDKFMSA